jgi:hypothetical protein
MGEATRPTATRSPLSRENGRRARLGVACRQPARALAIKPIYHAKTVSLGHVSVHRFALASYTCGATDHALRRPARRIWCARRWPGSRRTTAGQPCEPTDAQRGARLLFDRGRFSHSSQRALCRGPGLGRTGRRRARRFAAAREVAAAHDRSRRNSQSRVRRDPLQLIRSEDPVGSSRAGP